LVLTRVNIALIIDNEQDIYSAISNIAA